MWNIFSGEPICVSQNIFSNQSFILTLTESWGEALGCKVDLGPALCWSWESRVWRAVFWRTWLDTIQHILEGFGFRGKEFVVWVLVRRICFLSFFLFLCLLVEKEKHLSRWMSSRLGEPVRFGNWFITRGLPKSLKNENRGLPKSLKIHVAHTPDHQSHKFWQKHSLQLPQRRQLDKSIRMELVNWVSLQLNLLKFPGRQNR